MRNFINLFRVSFQQADRSVWRTDQSVCGQRTDYDTYVFGGHTMIQSIVKKCMLHNKLVISVMLCYYQAMLVNLYVLRLNTRIQQFIRPNTIAMLILTSWSHTSRVRSDVSTRGDKHTIHDNRRATCHCRMRTLHPTKMVVAQIARSDPMKMRSNFPVAPVHDNQYGRTELLMWLQDPITNNTTADHRMLRKFNFFLFVHSMSACFGYSNIH